MKTLILLAAILGLLGITPSPTQAIETLEIYADSTLSGNAGSLMRISEPGFIRETVFLFEEAGKIRVFAVRDAGSSVWDVLPGSQYLCQSQSMSIGNSWRFLNDDLDNETIATVAAQENVTTAAGTFATYRVDIARTSTPGIIDESMYFSLGVGFVRDMGFFGGGLDWQDDLTSYSIVGGSGYFPLAVGNTWVHEEISLAVENHSWGGVKALFQ